MMITRIYDCRNECKPIGKIDLKDAHAVKRVRRGKTAKGRKARNK